MVDVSVTATSSDQNLTDSPHYLAETLIKNGVKHMYGVVGIPVTDFARIAQGMGIRFIGMRHEEDAVNAAAAEGFLTGRPAVALTVSAPGFLNGLAPLLEATTNGFPVIMIGGSSTRHVVDMHEGEYEGLDQMNYAKQFCKESFRIDKIEDIPLAVARAMHIACSGRPGGVYIDFPDDAVAQTLERLTLLMEAQTDAHDALQIAQIYRQVEAVFSVGGGMSDGLMMEQYLKLGETDAALCCLKRLSDVAVGPAMTPNPILFAPTISPRTQESNAAGVARHAFARPAGGRGACRPSGNADLSRRGFAAGGELKISKSRRKRLGNGLPVRLFCAIV